MTSAIKEAVALAKHIPLEEIELSLRKLAIVSDRIEYESALFNNLLGIEELSKPRVKESLAVLKQEQTELQNHATLGARYHLLSMEPLTWRDKNGWPRLVVFSLDSPHFEIFASRDPLYSGTDFTKNISPKLPKAIASCYEDVLEKLQRDIGLNNPSMKISLKLSCRFEGLIPDDAKQKIIEAHGLFKEIFIIAEPNDFEINKTAIVVPKRDPFIVGFDGSQLWLIADFETTSVEEAMIFSLSDMKGERGAR